MTQEEYDKLIMLPATLDAPTTSATPATPTTVHTVDTTEPINPDDFEIPEENRLGEMYFDILNIYNIYFRHLYHQSPDSGLCDGIDPTDPTATNRALEKLYEEIHKYKTATDKRYTDLFDPEAYRATYLSAGEHLPEDHPLYLIEVDGEQKVCHNLITGLCHIASTEWHQNEWSINQINEF